MMSLILTFLRTHWVGASVTAAGFGIFALMSVQHAEIDSLRKKVNEAAAENMTLTRANAALVVSIKNQNEAIDIMEAKSAANEKAAALARKQAEESAKIYRLRARSIETARSSGNECADLRNLVHAYLNDAH